YGAPPGHADAHRSGDSRAVSTLTLAGRASYRPLAKPFARPLADHDRGQVDVRARARRHDGRVGDVEALNAVDAEVLVYDGIAVVCGAHAGGAARVEAAGGDMRAPGEQRLVVLEDRLRRREQPRIHRGEALVRADAGSEPHAVGEPSRVLRTVAEVVLDPRRLPRVGRCQRHAAARVLTLEHAGEGIHHATVAGRQLRDGHELHIVSLFAGLRRIAIRHLDERVIGVQDAAPREVRDADKRVVVEVRADAWRIAQDGDAMLAQVRLRADARTHEDRRCADGARRQDDAVSLDAFDRTVCLDLEACSARA